VSPDGLVDDVAMTDNHNHIYTDRSRLELKGKCPQAYYWNYLYHNRGIQLAREIPPPFALLTGTHTHDGIEGTLKGARPEEIAIAVANEYIREVNPIFDDIEDGPAKDNLRRQLTEQSQLVTALTYGWSKVRMPDYLATYEPIDIEREEEITFMVGDVEITLLTRTDILSKIRGSDNMVIHDLKSTGTADDKWIRQWRYDQLTLTEYIAVENSDNDYQAKYKWRCELPHLMSKGKECPGGQNHTRSGYHKVSVADSYPGGIIAWIDHLTSTDISVLQPYFITLPPITRSEWEVERWKRQTLAREIDDTNHAREIERLITIEPDTAALLLDHYFPMSSAHGNCFEWNTPCQYLDICWGSADPDDPIKFKRREYNHPREGE
jgi:hypothetical protein